MAPAPSGAAIPRAPPSPASIRAALFTVVSSLHVPVVERIEPQGASGMADKSSFHTCSGRDDMGTVIATEARMLVMEAAEPVRPGDTVKAQMRRAWTELGRPAFWRVRAAWYLEAGCWSAAALEDLRARAAARRAKSEARARADLENALALFSRQREALAAVDADFHREEIDRLGRVVEQLRHALADGGAAR